VVVGGSGSGVLNGCKSGRGSEVNERAESL